MDPQDHFCRNRACRAYGRAGEGHVVIHSRAERRYRCKRCRRTFAETAGTALYRLRTARDEVVTVVTLLAYGCPVQAIVAAFGGRIDPAPEPRHGKTSPIRHDGRGIFAGLPDPFQATRYHSLAAVTLPDDLEACAWSEDDVVQGVRHRHLDVHGVQFHPESIMTTEGKSLLANFLKRGVPSREPEPPAPAAGPGPAPASR